MKRFEALHTEEFAVKCQPVMLVLVLVLKDQNAVLVLVLDDAVLVLAAEVLVLVLVLEQVLGHVLVFSFI